MKSLFPEAEVTRLLYSSLLKMGFTDFQSAEKRVIDTNEMVALRLEKIALKKEREGEQLSGEDADGGVQSNVIKADDIVDYEAAVAQARETADEIIEQAKADALAEADALLADTRAKLEKERADALAEAREQGYQEGMQRAGEEFAAMEQALREKEKALEAGYEELLDELEPKFVDAITGVYEHLFQVELSDYHEILIHLIASAVRRIEGGRDFLVHVSGEDYPYVSMEKKKLTETLASPNATLELVEDVTLGRNECMIETEGGIFDCGLGTQLAELTQKLKLLSYEKA